MTAAPTTSSYKFDYAKQPAASYVPAGAYGFAYPVYAFGGYPYGYGF